MVSGRVNMLRWTVRPSVPVFRKSPYSPGVSRGCPD